MRINNKDIPKAVFEKEAKDLAKRFELVENKTKFCLKHGIDKTMLNQNLNGSKPISLRYAQVYAKAFDCKISEISQRIVDAINLHASVPEGFGNSKAKEDFAEQSNAVNLPLLNVTASMGNGNNVTDEVVVDMLRVNKSWVDKTLSPISNIKNLAFIHAIGDSMSPTFNDGDILLVDSGSNTVTSDNIYVLEAHDRLFIKRVRRRLSGEFEISSDNPSVKTVDTLNGDHDVTVKGRVVWVWNGRKV